MKLVRSLTCGHIRNSDRYRGSPKEEITDEEIQALNLLLQKQGVNHARATEIITQIREGKWRWMGPIKRFRPEDHKTLEERYEALSQHHEAETQHLISVVRELCEAIEAGGKL